ncbi:MAG: reverse transcriptase-like protein [Acidobacteria bacterium]|nr:reverse transcriptase-like protein [Acidobacteriota bacterium]
MTALKLVRENGSPDAAETYTPIVSIYADASCLRNGSSDPSAGCGAVIVDRNRMDLKILAKYLGPMTNQQAEILACVKALEELRRPCRVEIFSDSRYVIDTMNGRNRMKTNRTFWGRLVEQSFGHHITWRWVKGHDGLLFQEAADRLARAASTAQTDLLSDDIDLLREHLSDENSQLNIRSFEIELHKIISRYTTFGHPVNSHSTFDGVASLPSAFSA